MTGVSENLMHDISGEETVFWHPEQPAS